MAMNYNHELSIQDNGASSVNQEAWHVFNDRVPGSRIKWFNITGLNTILNHFKLFSFLDQLKQATSTLKFLLSDKINKKVSRK